MEPRFYSPANFANLKKKKEFALEEIKRDSPVIALSFEDGFEDGMYIASFSESKAHQKIVVLADFPGMEIILCALGNKSDLVYFKNVLRRNITSYTQAVNGKDLSGRVTASTAARILREYYLYEPKALAIASAIIDPFDPEDPICALSFDGEQMVGESFVLGETTQEIKIKFKTLKEAKSFTKENLGKSKDLFLQEHICIRKYIKKVQE